MIETRDLRRHAGFWGILGVCVFLPACDGTGDSHAPWLHPAPDASNVVQRPVYGPPEGKPFFVSGYAGASYPPLGVAPPIPGSPTSFAGSPPPGVTIEHGTWCPD